MEMDFIASPIPRSTRVDDEYNHPLADYALTYPLGVARLAVICQGRGRTSAGSSRKTHLKNESGAAFDHTLLFLPGRWWTEAIGRGKPRSAAHEP